MVEIVPVGEADLPVLCEWRLRFLAEERGLGVDDLSPQVVRATRDFLGRGHREGEQLSWLAVVEEQIVGVVTMLVRSMAPRPEDLRAREGYVINLFVDRVHRTQGIGRGLMAAVLAGAQALDLREVVLHATDHGRPLYESMGFTDSASWMHLLLPDRSGRA